MIGRVYQAIHRVGILLILVAVGGQEAAAQPACTRGVFVYLDVSGSMYSTSEAYVDKNRVTYNGQEMSILDAMLKFMGGTFGNRAFLRTGDYFSFNVFAQSVQEYREIQQFSSNEARRLRGLHGEFDRNGDGRVNGSDLAQIFRVNRERTSFVALLDEIERDVVRFNSRSEQEEAVTVIVFSDAFYDDKMETETEVEARLKDFDQHFGRILDEGRFTFLFVPLIETQVKPTFEEFAPPFLVKDFVLAATEDGDGLIRDVQAQIQQTLQDKVQIIERETVRNAPVEGREDWYRFAIPVRNVSCLNGDMTFEVHYDIVYSETQEKVDSWGFDRSKTFRPYRRDTLEVNLDFSSFNDGRYQVTFELTDRRTGVTTHGLASFRKGGPPFPVFIFFMLFMLLLLGLGYVYFAFVRKPKRGPSAGDLDSEYDRRAGTE